MVWYLITNHEKVPRGEPIKLVDPGNDIWELKAKVKDISSIAFRDVDAGDLIVWRCKLPKLLASQNIDQLTSILDTINLSDTDQADRLISSTLLTSLNLDDFETLIVQKAIFPVNRVEKRRHKESDISEELAQRKRNKQAIDPPSILAKPGQYERMQRDEFLAILDDRPKPDGCIPPISLLYDGFGQFLDIFDGRENVNGLAGIDFSTLVKKVDQFADAMCEFYPNEDTRKDVGLARLNEIFAARRPSLPSHDLRPSTIGSDGHYNGPHGVASTIVEFKNWTAGITSLPDVQLVSYFAHSQGAGITSSEDQKRFYGWRIPCLGLVVIGHEIRFYALLTLGFRFRLISLTPSISCIAAASDGRERKVLRTAFVAASVLQARIYADTNHHLQSPVSTTRWDTQLPYLPATTKIGTVKIGHLLSWDEPRENLFLYRATTSSGELIVVKFAPTYSSELHGYCADKGHAPRLLACERLPGGWYGVAMEYLDCIEPISRSPDLGRHRSDWNTQLRMLVKSFHDQGLVHGDLRDANIVCNAEGRLWLIDFDWGGTEGTAYYPTSNLHEELCRNRLSTSLAITKEDDNRVLEITLKKLDEIIEATT